jgi:hypothetical protein
MMEQNRPYRPLHQCWEVQGILRKNRIHRVVTGESMHDFMQAWKRSVVATSASKACGLGQWFIASAAPLAQKGYTINMRKKFLTKGFLIWEQ